MPPLHVDYYYYSFPNITIILSDILSMVSLNSRGECSELRASPNNIEKCDLE